MRLRFLREKKKASNRGWREGVEIPAVTGITVAGLIFFFLSFLFLLLGFGTGMTGTASSPGKKFSALQI